MIINPNSPTNFYNKIIILLVNPQNLTEKRSYFSVNFYKTLPILQIVPESLV